MYKRQGQGGVFHRPPQETGPVEPGVVLPQQGRGEKDRDPLGRVRLVGGQAVHLAPGHKGHRPRRQGEALPLEHQLHRGGEVAVDLQLGVPVGGDRVDALSLIHI